MSENAIAIRLRLIDELHGMSVELLRTGRKHYETLHAEGKATERELARFKKYLT